MKIAYLVLAHNNEAVLARAVQKLAAGGSRFYVHIDRKSDVTRFAGLRGDGVHFCEERVPVYWGDFSQVEAILVLMRAALAGGETPDYCVLISGADYPLRSAGYIAEYLEAHRGAEFINVVKVPAPGKPLARINTLRYPHSQPVRRWASRALARVGLMQRDYRKAFRGMEPYSGSTWWALTREACRYVLAFEEEHPGFVRFCKGMFAVDEAFFHTILGNSSFRGAIRRNLHYEDWSDSGSHPVTITERHMELFEGQDAVLVNDVFGHGEALFARKLSDANLALLQRIDAMTEAKERRRAQVS